MKNTRWFIAALLAIAAAPLGASVRAQETPNSEIETLRQEVRELRELVQGLRSSIKSGSPPSTPFAEAPPTASPSSPTDPLAAVEQSMSLSRSPLPTSTSNAPTSRPDPIDATIDVIKAGPTRTITGSPQSAFNPLISVVSDFAYNDPAPSEAAGIGENRDRATIREVEFAFQSPIDPFSRADIFVAVPNLIEGGAQAENVELEEAFISYWRLPWNLQLRGGKWFLPFGKENPTHSHEYAYVDRSLVGHQFLGEEGISGAGAGLQTSFNLGDEYTTQVQLSGNLVSPKGEESLFVGPLEDEKLALGRLNLYHEFSPDTNLDVGYTHMLADHDPAAGLNQRLQGLDVTCRWEPTADLGYSKLLLRSEYFWGARRVDPANLVLPGATSVEKNGIYAMANYTFDKYFEVGARWDNTAAMRGIAEQLADTDASDGLAGNSPGDRLHGWATWLTWHSTEFNRFRLQYSRIESSFPRNGSLDEDIVSLQWTWVMGPHGAHKY